jgi:general secretion pathway protein J
MNRPPPDPGKQGQPRPNRRCCGFTLIELLVAIAILAVVAVLSWRGLDQIVRLRHVITLSIEETRALAQLFTQLQIDTRSAVLEYEINSPAVIFDAQRLQIVRHLNLPGVAPRLQVIRYYLADAHVIRAASPPLATVGGLHQALSTRTDTDDWSTIAFMNEVTTMRVRAWRPKQGWTTAMQKAPPGNKRFGRQITGLEVSLAIKNMPQPLTRVLLLGE